MPADHVRWVHLQLATVSIDSCGGGRASLLWCLLTPLVTPGANAATLPCQRFFATGTHVTPAGQCDQAACRPHGWLLQQGTVALGGADLQGRTLAATRRRRTSRAPLSPWVGRPSTLGGFGAAGWRDPNRVESLLTLQRLVGCGVLCPPGVGLRARWSCGGRGCWGAFYGRPSRPVLTFANFSFITCYLPLLSRACMV